MEKYQDMKGEMQHLLTTRGTLSLNMGNYSIVKIKSIQSWGSGLFYGFMINQQSFSKSVDMSDIVSFS